MSTLRSTIVLLGLVLAARGLRAQDWHGSHEETGTQLRGFVDVTMGGSNQPASHSAFSVGQYDFFLSSRLANHISFLGESVFDFDKTFIVKVERIIVSFSPKPYFSLAVGRHHTPIGFWNTAYHHGALLQPTIGRPALFVPEARGGILPIHTVGIAVSGRDISRFHLGYDVMVGNGIGATPTTDNNGVKSVTVAVHSQVTSKLQVGGSVYVDRIAAGTPSIGGTPVTEDIDERIYGGYVVYQSPSIELMGEFQHAMNSPRQSGVTSGTDGLYAYGGYRFGRLVPYVRYDRVGYSASDPYYLVNDLRQGLVGARYDFAPTVVGKLEVQRRKTGSSRPVTQVMAQVAVGF